MKLVKKLSMYLVAAAAFAPFTIFAQEDAAGAPAGFFEIVTGGNAMDKTVWIMIGLTSLATVALIIDSFLSIRSSKIMPATLVDAVKGALAEGDLGAAIEACEQTPGPLSNILMAGFNNISEGYDVILDAVSSAASIESEKLMQRVNYLNLCGQLAPMFGLMGTVTGMAAGSISSGAHIGDICYYNGKIYGSLEYKNDAIGKGILAKEKSSQK